uniref:Uncharacterized protein n=1 Tax=Arundo donax TaxID=35708 RepID=A0A0A8Z494_ARUDO
MACCDKGFAFLYPCCGASLFFSHGKNREHY